MRNLQIPSSLIDELKVPQMIDITDELPKSRGGWDALVAPRKLEALTDIVWHHTAEFVADNIKPETHANNHIKAGEGGFPYHIYIKNGEISQGNDLLTFTYGVSSNNYQTVHAVVEGCYAPKNGRLADDLSEENKRAMIAVELTLRVVMTSYKQTNGHNYYSKTLCPGYSMTKFREDCAAVEAKLDFLNSEAGLNDRAFRMANVVLYYYNMSKGFDEYGNPVTLGKQKWAQQRLLLLEPAMKEHEFV